MSVQEVVKKIENRKKAHPNFERLLGHITWRAKDSPGTFELEITENPITHTNPDALKARSNAIANYAARYMALIGKKLKERFPEGLTFEPSSSPVLPMTASVSVGAQSLMWGDMKQAFEQAHEAAAGELGEPIRIATGAKSPIRNDPENKGDETPRRRF